MLSKLLIANRGEIALRVIRASRELGVRSVAVYSDADRTSPHVLAADEAYRVGPAPAPESYLRMEEIIAVARRCGADAIHPGYGFLAERAAFIEMVREAGLVFVGPSAEAVAAMGDKTAARKRMVEAGVPVVPGTLEPVADIGAARAQAESIGYPVLLKASAGGGGKGMRIVRGPGELASAFQAAGREALAAFGDGSLYLERLIERPRHIEIQVLADGQGGVVHLGERECSIQRRHQKLIEEAPSVVLTPEQRAAMGAAAVAAARAVDYRGAGTVEFLYRDGEYYFLEMNTRIQVEHPVTEMITGIDLVQWQLRIAAGELLAFSQEDIDIDGHAIECRITAEDPGNAFLPSTGRIEMLEVPAGPGVRWDGGIALGSVVGLHYDPLLGKLIVHAPTRELAIRRMTRALRELRIVGVDTILPFHLGVMDEPEFRSGRVDIEYLDRHGAALVEAEPDERTLRAAAIVGALLEDAERRRPAVQVTSSEGEGSGSAWKRATGWRGR